MSRQQTKATLFQQPYREAGHQQNEEMLHEYLDEGTVTTQFHDYSGFILCVTRVWSRIAHKNMRGQQDEDLHKCLNIWTQKFCSLGGTEAAKHWDAFLSCLTRNARRTFMLGCACCGRVSNDEQLMLSILYDVQSQNLHAARDSLSQLMWDVEIPNALHDLIMFTSFMKDSQSKIDLEVLSALKDSDYTSKHKMH